MKIIQSIFIYKRIDSNIKSKTKVVVKNGLLNGAYNLSNRKLWVAEVLHPFIFRVGSAV